MTKERYADTLPNKLAAAAAETFGGEHIGCNLDGEYFDHYAETRVPPFGDALGYRLSFRQKGYGADKNKVEISLLPHSWEAQNKTGDVDTRGITWPSACVDGTRELQKLMADISRRVANAPEAQEALKTYALRIAEAQTKKSNLAAQRDALLAELPHLRTSANYPPERDSQRLFASSGHSIAELRIHADGAISIDRLYRLPNQTGRAILRLLADLPR